MTTHDDLPNLDIRISPAQAGRYSVEMQIGEREFPIGTLGQDALLAGAAGAAEEGVRLFSALVADVALRSAWDQAGALYPRRRIRLRIDDAAPELHTLAWELLHDPSPAAAVRSLAADLDTPLSRYVACPWEPLGPAPAPLKVLTAVASPRGLENYDLAPIDRERETALLRDALALAPAGLVQHTVLPGPCSLVALAAELERGYHVLHLVAHGAVTSDRTGSVMFLENADGALERVDSGRFSRTIDCLSRSLRLVVLMSCNTATRSPTDARFGFAPSLLAAGIPAVLAMQDLMPMSTAAAFTRAFYEELWQSGQIDRAANRARRVVVTERLPGNAVPALYATRMSLRLWVQEAPSGHVAKDMPENGLHGPAGLKSSEPPAPAPAGPPEQPASAPASAPVPKDMSEKPGRKPAGVQTWRPFGGPFSDVQVIRGAEGLIQVFGLDDAAVILQRWEDAPGKWSGWAQFDDEVAQFAAVTDLRDRATVFAHDDEGWIWYSWEDAEGEWEDWRELDGQADRLVAGTRKDGSLVLVGQTEGGLRLYEQKRAGGAWDEPRDLDGVYTALILARNGIDQMALFGVTDDGTLWTIVQREPRGDWGEWEQLGTEIRSVFTLAGADGRLHLAAIDVSQNLRWWTETEPGAGWGPPQTLASDCIEVSATASRDGALAVYTIDTAGTASLRRLQDGTVTATTPLGGAKLKRLWTIENKRGQIEVFALDEGGKLLHLPRS